MGWLFACNRTRRLHSGTTPTRSVLHQRALYFTNALCTSPMPLNWTAAPVLLEQSTVWFERMNPPGQRQLWSGPSEGGHMDSQRV